MKIDKNVPMPTSQANSKYPFWDMDVGDSFLIDGNEVQSVRNASHMCGKRNEMKFTVRKTAEGYRCWRIA